MKRFIYAVIILLLLFSTTTAHATTWYSWRYRESADCDAETDGKARDLCYDTGNNVLYKCEPAAGDCDTAGEWKSSVETSAPATFTSTIIGDLNVSGLTASEIVITDASKNLASAAVATYPSLAELAYVKGLTSAIQTQINAKGAHAGQAYTGIHDWGSVTSFEFSQDGTVNAIGKCTLDTTDFTLVCHDGTAARVMAHSTYQQTACYYGDIDWSAKTDLLVMRAPKEMAVTLIEIYMVAYGSTSRYNMNERAPGSEFTPASEIMTVDAVGATTGNTETGFSDSSIAANAGVYLAHEVEGGTMTGFCATTRYTKDVE